MKHLEAQGICNVFEDTAVVNFLRAACHDGLDTGRPVIELFALECDAEVLAVFGGAANDRRLSCMFNSYTEDPEHSRWSPGLVLLTHLVQYCGERRIGKFDLGAGHAFYKTIFCKETEGAFDTILGFTPAGRLAAYALTAARESKRRLKATPAIWETLKTLRRVVRG
jgi:CelD/BcsL family acetyltransferase involved in cellulose biosynthesis